MAPTTIKSDDLRDIAILSPFGRKTSAVAPIRAEPTRRIH
jgi:hypothetical protein